MGTRFLRNKVAMLRMTTKENPPFCLALSLVIATMQNVTFLEAGKLHIIIIIIIIIIIVSNYIRLEVSLFKQNTADLEE